MHQLKHCLFLLFVCFSFSSCNSGQSILQTSEISGYDKEKAEHIIFLNLKISDEGKGDIEKVKLINATAGNGRMKNLRVPVEYPYQIKAIPRFTASHLETEMVFEHPLYRSVEVPNQDGSLNKTSIKNKEGVLSIRFQEDRTMDRIEFYSVTPERGTVKIYTLNLKI